MTDFEGSDDAPSRPRIARDLLIFQVKLWLEGFKDVVLMPLSFGAALIDLVVPGSGRRSALYSVMKLGKRFERWVHLYAALEKTEVGEKTGTRLASLDDLLIEAADGLDASGPKSRPTPKDPTSSES